MSTKLAATFLWLLGPLRVGVLGEGSARVVFGLLVVVVVAQMGLGCLQSSGLVPAFLKCGPCLVNAMRCTASVRICIDFYGGNAP